MDRPLLKTAVFVDYEYWYASEMDQFQTQPNIGLWVSDLKTRGRVNELTFFGDFTEGELYGEVKHIRSYTNRIIDTRKLGHFKKDYTDFIMLDHIYQKIISAPDTEQVILFTGDAHFSSVASYLKLSCDKSVGLYGITGTIAQQMISIVDWVIEMPLADSYLDTYIDLVIENFQKMVTRPRFRPTFRKTAEHIALHRRVDYSMVEEALRYMIQKGLLYQESVLGEEGEVQLRYLSANWEALRAAGYIDS